MGIQNQIPEPVDGPLDSGSRPRGLVLAGDVLFDHFFSESTQARLSEVCDWSRYSGREDSQELRDKIAAADALMTTWHSPFLVAEMFGATPRVRLIAHCGGEVKARAEQRLIEQITVTNAAEPMTQPVAEMALTLMLTLVRRLTEESAKQKTAQTSHRGGADDPARGGDGPDVDADSGPANSRVCRRDARRDC